MTVDSSLGPRAFILFLVGVGWKQVGEMDVASPSGFLNIIIMQIRRTYADTFTGARNRGDLASSRFLGPRSLWRIYRQSSDAVVVDRGWEESPMEGRDAVGDVQLITTWQRFRI